jgi:CDP-2,3-bis-(O-geranylgeranyl)-sn-glycerol synthase
MIIAKLFYFFLPVAMANMAPVIFKNYFKFLAIPIDGGKKIGGKDIFGSHKTWRGLILATLLGGAIYCVQYLLAYYFPHFNNIPYNYFEAPWWFGFLFSFGAIMGDLIKSFFKRRLNLAPGRTWIPFDQIDFLIGSTIVLALFFPVLWYYWLLILGIGLFLHVGLNRIGYWLKLKNTPW